MGMTAALAAELAGIRQLTEADREQLHRLILDFFAAAFAGIRVNRAFNAAVEQAVFPQGGVPESVVFLRKERVPARTAAFMNAVYGHGAELDDGHKKAAGHAGVHLIPAVFALADRLGSSGEEVLLALTAGYEAYIRISSAAQPGMIQRGFHSTGVAGTLACAAACARLYGLDAAGMEDAIALATTMSGGLLSYGDSRPAIKPLNPGKAAENGLFAAMLAREGVRGPAEALEGPNGWFRAVTDQADPACLAATDHYQMHDCYFKRFPSCRHTHCGIDAAIALHGQVKPEDIAAVEVFIYPNAIRLAGIQYPKDADETKFSIPYTLARALLTGSYGIGDMDTAAMTGAVRQLIGKIQMIPDASMEDKAAGIRGARVRLTLRDGTRLEETVTVPRGDPENPLTREELEQKLAKCAGEQVPAETLKALMAAVWAVKGDQPFVNPMLALES